MGDAKPTVVVTGISGNLGTRLLPQLARVQCDWSGRKSARDRSSFAIRAHGSGGGGILPPALSFACATSRAEAVVHLAFVLDPVRAGVLDVDRMWQINVAGTARVMEAITEANHDRSDGPEIYFSQQRFGLRVGLDRTGDARNIRWAPIPCPTRFTRWNRDKVVQQRAPALRGCSAYMLRPHIFAGASVENYMVGAFRGTPGGRSDRAASMRSRGKRLPCLLPRGQRYLDNRIQFVHVDDMARLIDAHSREDGTGVAETDSAECGGTRRTLDL